MNKQISYGNREWRRSRRNIDIEFPPLRWRRYYYKKHRKCIQQSISRAFLIIFLAVLCMMTVFVLFIHLSKKSFHLNVSCITCTRSTCFVVSFNRRYLQRMSYFISTEVTVTSIFTFSSRTHNNEMVPFFPFLFFMNSNDGKNEKFQFCCWWEFFDGTEIQRICIIHIFVSVQCSCAHLTKNCLCCVFKKICQSERERLFIIFMKKKKEL